MPAGPVAATKAASFQDRINHLEGLVVQLLQQQQDETPGSKLPKLCAKCSGPLEQRPGSSPSAATPHTSSSAAPMVTIDQVNASTAAIARNFSLPPATPSASHVHSTLDVGRLQIDSVKSAYVSSPHWTAVLNGLSELKTFWEAPEEEDAEEFFPGDQSGNQYYKTESGAREETPLHMLPVAPSQQPKTRRFQLLYGEHREQTLEEILLVVPPRDVVDRLVLLYFNNLMLPRMFLPLLLMLQELVANGVWHVSGCFSFRQLPLTGKIEENQYRAARLVHLHNIILIHRTPTV